MKIQKISVSFSRYTDANLQATAANILQCMTGNANFPTPIPTLADLHTALTAYIAALTNAIDGGKNNVAIKNQCRATLESLLGQLGMYVMFVANGDVTILTSSGYTLTKVPEPQPLIAPEKIVVKNGITSGQLTAVVTRVKGASYLFEIAADPLTATSTWSANPSRASKFTFTGLQPGQKYWLRTAAVGKKGELAFSPNIAQIAQ